MTLPADGESPSRLALHYRGFRFFAAATLATTFGVQIISVSVGWQIWEETGNALFLGLVGLAQYLPALSMVLLTGLVADRFSRRRVMAICLFIEAICALGLLFIAINEGIGVLPIFGALVVLGLARAFMGPASDSLAPNLVPPEALANAISINASAWQLAAIAGPMTGGLLYGLGGPVAYGTAAILICVSLTCVLFIPRPPQPRDTQATSLTTMLAGFRYIRDNRIVFGAISLDLFAVLLGGATALMPIYASDILEAGPLGLGLLRAAPGIGAIGMALWLAKFPIRTGAGHKLFFFVALFGLATIIFGFSWSVWMAVPALVVMGAADMVSVAIRETIMQLWTPDEVRGRVSAVNRVFIGASNELGEFRAGVMAFWLGAIAAVTIGGAGTMGVAALWAKMFPELRRIQNLDRKMV
ncbi:MFS transporter [Arsenicitalea aurantiaca]|uniref:MFS transporter n=1 Tax=Arsenicitalea aurantiaca TaxID=1783274 RepID=A0A433XGK4_9HYPH|nr:MFS transporter [Arsenicitalea aurantiaca]RUT33215.1 MFS transporter [Arsenicitalea aurantiaca]